MDGKAFLTRRAQCQKTQPRAAVANAGDDLCGLFADRIKGKARRMGQRDFAVTGLRMMLTGTG